MNGDVYCSDTNNRRGINTEDQYFWKRPLGNVVMGRQCSARVTAEGLLSGFDGGDRVR
jgi:hypothetical protein